MEDKNYRDDFELFLKESTDEFRMVPSRKVWYSIYNNMHPDRRWPSMTVCMLILSAVLYIGIENNNSLSNAARKYATENFNPNLNENTTDKNITFLNPTPANTSTQKQLPVPLNNTAQFDAPVITENISAVSQINSNDFIPNTNLENQLTNIIPKEKNEELIIFSNKKLVLRNKKLQLGEKTTLMNEVQNNTNETVTFQQDEKNVLIPDDILSDKEMNVIAKHENAELLKNLSLITEKSWKEDYAFRNKPAINKLKQNGSLSYYVTPSVGYRNFAKKNGFKSSTTSSNNFTNRILSADKNADDNFAVNLELGASFQYAVSSNIRIKSGLQANYTNYTSNVSALGHPTQVAIDVNNSIPFYGVSNYSSTSGKTKLNQSSIQLAVPLGADVKLAGTGNLAWYVGATLQPTYLLKGSAYVLSTDAEYYAKEPTLLRKLNLNSAIETFVSFKSSTGVTMTVGPQFRYQLFSTYKNQYNYSERLYNIGVKLGISTTF
jgi:hypothetical protein